MAGGKAWWCPETVDSKRPGARPGSASPWRLPAIRDRLPASSLSRCAVLPVIQLVAQARAWVLAMVRASRGSSPRPSSVAHATVTAASAQDDAFIRCL